MHLYDFQILELEEYPDIKISTNIAIATLMAAVRNQRPDVFLDTLVFTVRTEILTTSGKSLKLIPKQKKTSITYLKFILPTESPNISPSSSSANIGESEGSAGLKDFRTAEYIPGVFNITPLPSTVEVFSRIGGLGLLAKHLPVVYPETLRQIAVGSKFTGSVGLVMNVDKDSPVGANDNEWVKIESAEDFYDVRKISLENAYLHKNVMFCLRLNIVTSGHA